MANISLLINIECLMKRGEGHSLCEAKGAEGRTTLCVCGANSITNLIRDLISVPAVERKGSIWNAKTRSYREKGPSESL